MSSNSTNGSSQPQIFEIDAVTARYFKREQAFGIYNGVWLGILFTVAVALVLLSTPAQRRGSVFWIQCLAFLMAFTNALLVTMAVVKNFQQIFVPDQDMTVLLVGIESAQKAFEMFTPLVSDSTLIFKVLAFYPATLEPNRLRRLIPILPLLILGLGRLVTCTLIVISYYFFDLDPYTQRGTDFSWIYIRATLAEFSMQIAYCSYATAILFRKIYIFAQHRRPSSSQTPAVARKLRYLIESLAMTFFLPVIAQIVALAGSAASKGNLTFVASLTNVYLSTLFSVLATSWSTIRLTRMQQARSSSSQFGGASSQGSGEERKASLAEKGALIAGPSTPGGDVQTKESEGFLGGNLAGQHQRLLPPSQLQQANRRRRATSDADDVGDAHRNTLLAKFFNNDDDDDLHVGQTTQIEVLHSFQQTHSSGGDGGAMNSSTKLPARDTSYWRRGLLRPGQ